ncbi:hypothetical protein K2173_000186 [Erythroxylum novogranatense]|uniref:Uncharacterized protein n=1 Tax=Erythroxylum novogranatense TaxID=1862640 RepID=A0AAV8SNS2_9ROSI|nr:hypothetical protein K2173_000186 [Erythroxylum novogranatense]
MEDEKKKKRNKKKKNKQNKTADDNAAVGNGQNDHNHEQVPALSDVENVDEHRPHPNGIETSSLVEAEKQKWLQREVILKDTIRQLQNENILLSQKKDALKETIKQLQDENEKFSKKEATLEDTVSQLRSTNDSFMQEKATFEETIEQLKIDNESHKQKEYGLELKIIHLQGEKDSWLQNENTVTDAIARQNVDLTRLQMQVVELEECRNGLLKENQQLVEKISGRHSQIQNLETSVSSTNLSDELRKSASEIEDLNSQIEAASQLIEKLITENSDLVEKVNELYIKLEQQNKAAGHVSDIGNGPVAGNPEIASIADPVHKSNERAVLGHNLELLEPEADSVVRYLPDVDSGEIVQIPLDDNEAVDLESQVVESNDNDSVPLSDAPLVGAPFRLISFVAKYVSGADLVTKNDSRP